MALDREIDALRRRISRISPLIKPPELKMHIIKPGMSEPESLSQWEMVVRIEPRPIHGL